MKKSILNNTELLVTGAVTIVCLFLVGYFPKTSLFQEVVVGLAFLLVIPALYCKIVLKNNLADLGIQTGSMKNGIIWMAVSAAMLFLIFYIIFHYTGFKDKYSPPQKAITDFRYFVLYEVLIVGFITALYEFFFRGFILFSFKKAFGSWSIILQTAIFLILLAFSDNADYSFIPLLASSLFSGITAYKCQSLIYSFAISFFTIVIVDSVIIRMLG